MKKKLLFIICLLSFLLISCNQVKESIYTPSLSINETYDKTIDYSDEQYRIEDYTIDLDVLDLKSMLDNKNDFCLFLHDTFCGHCHEFKPLVIRYILETKNTIYSLNTSTAALDMQIYEVKDANGTDIFWDGNNFVYSTPTFYFFKDGKILKKQVGTTNLLNYNLLKKTFNKYLITSSATYITNADLIDENCPTYYFNNSSFALVELYKKLLATPEIQLNLVNTIKFSMIKSYIQKEENILQINDTTSYEEVLSFLGLNN